MNILLIANRGAIARRIVRACRDLGIRSAVVFSEADAGAPYLEEADVALPLSGVTPRETYLNQDALLNLARESDADAIHPGYGFLAEHAGFAARVVDAGMTFVGPHPRWLQQMGDKVAARRLLSAQGFPMFPASELIEDFSAATDAARSIGYPVLVKPSGGGGGMGMELVRDPDGLKNALARASAIAANAFDHSGVYLEKWIERPRHIEFQVAGDASGRVMHFFERECSVQRRNQKLIEESPAPGLDAGQILDAAELSARVCAELGYDNLGTLETLFTSSGEMGFLEMNTRIQVEHGVTEAVTGVDLVGLQLRLADGGALPESVEREGFAVEARIYAEDSHQMLPSTGRLSVFRPPRHFGVRVETGYQEGQMVTPYYDALLAKVIALGDTREMAIGRLLVALKGFEVRGVETNQVLLRRVLEDERFLEGQVDTGIIERLLGR